jgi:phosphate-selective porin OprO/OprP
VLRTNLSPSGAGVGVNSAANAASVPFLAFNPTVHEQGARALWELHAAYYYGGLTLLGAWQSGYEGYAKTGASPDRIPINGWFVQAGYLLTGETIRDRTLIDPLRPFDLRSGRFGLGAFEVTARYSELDLSSRVFTAGLADPNLWTNRADMTDVGFNWYMNKFMKIYFDWEHSVFAQPVFFRPGGLQKTSDLFWLRFQVYL